MNQTKIEWATHTWNPVTGCTPISEGCLNCYAKRMARRLAGRYGYPDAPHHFDVTLHHGRLGEPLHWKKPRLIFVCSMGDLFHEDVPYEIQDHVLIMTQRAPQHTYLLLTKRPDRMLNFFRQFHSAPHDTRPLPNVWLGVTTENQDAANQRVAVLLRIPAALHFISAEPLLGLIDLNRIPGAWDVHQGTGNTIDWVICGGETGPGARPMQTQWAIALRDQCVAADVPFFYKGAGTAMIHKNHFAYPLLGGKRWEQFPDRVTPLGLS